MSRGFRDRVAHSDWKPERAQWTDYSTRESRSALPSDTTALPQRGQVVAASFPTLPQAGQTRRGLTIIEVGNVRSIELREAEAERVSEADHARIPSSTEIPAPTKTAPSIDQIPQRVPLTRRNAPRRIIAWLTSNGPPTMRSTGRGFPRADERCGSALEVLVAVESEGRPISGVMRRRDKTAKSSPSLESGHQYLSRLRGRSLPVANRALRFVRWYASCS